MSETDCKENEFSVSDLIKLSLSYTPFGEGYGKMRREHLNTIKSQMMEQLSKARRMVPYLHPTRKSS